MNDHNHIHAETFHDTRDLFEAAFLTSKGVDLLSLVRLEDSKPTGHPSFAFRFCAERAERLVTIFRSGRAFANVAVLRASMAYLRERLFNAIDTAKPGLRPRPGLEG